MRKILFRAMTKSGTMEEGLPYLGMDGYIEGLETLKGCTVLVDVETICQYAGVDDINGKHIYEGDILKIVTPNDDEDNPFVTEYYELAYNEKQRAFVLRSDCGDEPFDYSQKEMDEYKVEVVGNIYENEDLRGKVYGQ